jgi:hypothetical protein
VETWAVTVEEMNMFRIFERKLVRNIFGPLKEEHGKIRTNGIKDILEGDDTVKFIKFLQLRWFGHVEKYKTKECQNKLQEQEYQIKGGETR